MSTEMKKELSRIDCFHWEEFNSDTYKLVYVDAERQKNERLIAKATLDAALKIFNGKSHLIPRSTGAYSPTTPSQLLIFHNPFATAQSLIGEDFLRISTRFIDLERNAQGELLSLKRVVQHKSVRPSAFRLLDNQDSPFNLQYWLDLGHQILPISVFDFFRGEDEIIYALFAKTRDLKLASQRPKGERIEMRLYCAPEAVLRVSLPEETNKVIERYTATRSVVANPNEKSLETPEFLQFGSPISLPTGAPIEVLNHYLRICQDPHASSMKQSFLHVLEQPLSNEESLMPFGVFERA
jgi:hypothetical protein